MTELHDDDKPIGRLLSRREALVLLGGAGAAMLAGTGFTRLPLRQTHTPTPTPTSVPACIVRPDLTEGPYFVDDQLNRSDIRIDPSDNSVKAGIPLRLQFRVSDVTADACKPFAGVQVDVWHCDALGVYSGVQDRSFDTTGQKWLRGYQITDADGIAEFLTIYPGWYSGRTVHIHFKIRTDPDSEQGYEFTSQLFFEEDLTDKVYENQPYASKGQRDTYNEDDNIFQGSEGLLTLDIFEEDEGYAAIFDIGLDTSQPSSGGNDQPGGGRPGGGRP